MNYTHAHSTTPQLEFGERLISPPLPFFHVVSEEDSTEEGIPSPLAPSLLIAFYDTQRISWCYSLLYAQHHRAYFVYLAVNKVNLTVKSTKNHFQKLDSNLAKLDSAFVLSEALTFFTASIDAVDRTVRQTLLDLQEVRLTGKISLSLLPPSRLQKILQDLLNHHLSLVFPPTLPYLPNYFEICSATVRMLKLDFLIFVRVPLQTDDFYDLHRLRPFAMPYENSKWSRRITDIQEYLGIRADRKVAMAMNDLANCLPAGDRCVCSPKSHFISTTQPSCPLALFQQDDLVESQCTFQYAFDIPTEFVRVSDRWVGTSHSAQKAEEVCPNRTRTIKIPAGLSSIPVKAGCRIITPDFVLPPFGLQGSSNLTLQVISHPLNSTPLAHLELEPLAKIKLQDLKPFKDSDLKFLKLRQAIYPAAYWSSSNSSHLALTIIISIGLVAVAAYLTFLRCRACTYVIEVRTRPAPARRNNARLSPINFFNRLPAGVPSPRPQMQTPNTSSNSSLTASPPSTPGAPLERSPVPPTTTTRSPTPVPSMSRNTLQVPEVRLTPPTGEVEMEYLEMVMIFKLITLAALFQISVHLLRREYL